VLLVVVFVVEQLFLNILFVFG